MMNEHIKKVVCVTGNYPDGQRICKARIEYDCEIDGESAANAFSVAQRNITGVSVEGTSVVLELDIRDRLAAIIAEPPPFKPGQGPKPGGPGGPGPGPGGPPNLPAAKREDRVVKVTQTADIKTITGEVIAADGEELVSTCAEEPVIEDFKQFEYKGIGYNLYLPQCWDGKTELPMVVFIHDAGVCGADTKITLSQGNGAVSFASPEWQKENPCIVLAPQINKGVKLTNDSFRASDEIYIIKELIDDVAERYCADKSRIYATGQSMGCMAFCELNILYPDYFAASLLVAGQWSPERMAEKCAGNKLWILVSNHDAKAFPGMNAVTEALENAGAKIGRYVWNAKSGAEELDKAAAEAMKDDVKIRYTVFEGSSVVPEYKDDNPATNHVCTWPVAYSIAQLKRWLFAQNK